MKCRSISNEIRVLGNLTRRYVENSPECKKITSLTGTNAWIIGYIASRQGEDVYQKDVEAEFGITRSTASKVVTKMEQKGFIGRVGVCGDARLKKLVLTPAGEEIHQMMDKVFRETEGRLQAGFSQEELDLFASFLHRMQDNIHSNETEGCQTIEETKCKGGSSI